MPVIRRHFSHGFSLLELSIALAVIGIVVAGGLSLSSNMVDQQAYVQTGNQMDEAEKALIAFVSVNKRLPCPSVPTLALTNDKFGLENCAGVASIPEVDGTAGRKVLIGGLPIRTLGLRDRYSADEYGNRYTYAVTKNHTTQTGYAGSLPADNGGITIKDGQNVNVIENAAFAIISHGGDGKGAYRYETANVTAKCDTGLDAENCDNLNAIFRDARFNRGSVANNWFDDTTRFMRREMINLLAGSTNNAALLWEENGNHIYNTNAGNVGIGQPNPLAKLDVSGIANQTALQVNAPSGAGTGLKVNSNGGVGIDVTTQNAAHGLLVNNITNEAGLSVITNGNNSDSIRVDHVGADGFGLKMMMNNQNSTGVSITMPTSDNSTGIRILQENTKLNTYGIDIDQTGKGTGLRSRVNNENGFAISAENLATTSTGGGISSVVASTQGRAIFGSATGNGSNAGVYGSSAGSGGTGVFGSAINTGGRGIYGEGAGFGVFGKGTANGASGVFGESSFANGVGVYGRNSAVNGYAVYGYATGTGTTYGVYGQSASGYGIWCQSSLCGGSVPWSPPSDKRLKEHVETLDAAHGLEAIRKLRPVTYTWRDAMRKPLGMQLGFIAQEVETVLPEVVLTGTDQEIDMGHGKKETVTKVKSMTYEVLTAPLVRAVQQLADQFDALFDTVKKLIARLDGHDADIRTLKEENAMLKKQNAAFEIRLKKLEATSQAAH